MRILLAIPSYNGQIYGGTHYAAMAAHALHPKEIDVLISAGSLLTRVFNTCWCECLNKDYTHFLMMHSDISPKHPGWIDQLLEIGEDADITSVVSPIKDSNGYTSTAVLDRKQEVVRRLTMHEVMQLPVTFDERKALTALGINGGTLLVNTGLMLIRMDKRKELEQMYFTIADRIVKGEKGLFEPYVMSEDWNWSILAKKLRLSVQATRAIELDHMGFAAFNNYQDWGTAEHDLPK